MAYYVLLQQNYLTKICSNTKAIVIDMYDVIVRQTLTYIELKIEFEELHYEDK